MSCPQNGDLAKQLSSSVSRDPVLFLFEDTCSGVESRVENCMASHPSLPGCTFHPLANPAGSSLKLRMDSAFPSPITDTRGLPCLHLISPQVMLKAASRPESGASPLCSLQRSLLHQDPDPYSGPQDPYSGPRTLTVAHRTPCLCSFAIRPDSLITTEPLHGPRHLSISHSLDIYIHGLPPRSGLSGVPCHLHETISPCFVLLIFLSTTHYLTHC